MTRNQIEFNKLLETNRSNLANEEIQRTRAATDRELGFANLSESQRHNMASERMQVLSLDETSRHNLATESNARAVLEEQHRSNVQHELLTAQQQAEQRRHNQAVEYETARSNVSREQEQMRSNRANEREAERAHRASETLRSAEVNESIRNHRALETLQSATVNQNIRYQNQQVVLRQQELAQNQAQFEISQKEIERSHQAQEDIQRQRNWYDYSVQTERNAIQRQQVENTAAFQAGQLQMSALQLEEKREQRISDVAVQTTKMQIDKDIAEKKQAEVERHNEYMENLQSSQLALARDQYEVTRGKAFFDTVFGGLNTYSKFDMTGAVVP